MYTYSFTNNDYIITDLPPKELDLFRHVEMPKTLPKGNEHLIKNVNVRQPLRRGQSNYNCNVRPNSVQYSKKWRSLS